MPIVEVQVPETRHFRESVFTTEDAEQAYALLTQEWTDDKGVERVGKPAGYAAIEDTGELTEKGNANKAESTARSRGITLNKMLKQMFGKRFAVTVYKDGQKDSPTYNHFIGALLPQPPKVGAGRKPAASNGGEPASGSRKKS